MQDTNLLPVHLPIKVHANIDIQNDIYYSMLSQHVLNASLVILLNIQCDSVIVFFFFFLRSVIVSLQILTASVDTMIKKKQGLHLFWQLLLAPACVSLL